MLLYCMFWLPLFLQCIPLLDALQCQKDGDNYENHRILYDDDMEITCQLSENEKQYFAEVFDNSGQFSSVKSEKIRNTPLLSECKYDSKTLSCDITGDDVDTFTSYNRTWNVVAKKETDRSQTNNKCSVFRSNILCDLTQDLFGKLSMIYEINDVGQIVINNSTWSVACNSKNEKMTCAIETDFPSDLNVIFNMEYKMNFVYREWSMMCDVKDKTISCLIDRQQFAEYSHLDEINATLNVLVKNTTFSKLYVLQPQNNKWKFNLSRSEYFEIYSDLVLPSKFLDDVYSLTWTMEASLCHSLMTKCIRDTWQIVDPSYDLFYKAKESRMFGEVVAEPELFNKATLVRGRVPCSTSSFVLVQQKNDVTYITVTWDSFNVAGTTQFKWDCSLVASGPCFSESATVKQVELTMNRVFVLTSEGIFASEKYSTLHNVTRKTLRYHRLPLSPGSGSRPTQIFYRVVCADRNQIKLKDDRIGIFLYQEDNAGKTLIIETILNPSTLEIIRQSTIESAGDASIVAYDSATDTTVKVTAKNQKMESTAYIQGSALPTFEIHSLPANLRTVWSDDGILYVAIGNDIYASMDKGITFTWVHQITHSNNTILSVTAGVGNKVCFLTKRSVITISLMNVHVTGIPMLATKYMWLNALSANIVSISYINQQGRVETQTVDVSLRDQCSLTISSDVHGNSVKYLDILEQFTYTVTIDTLKDSLSSNAKLDHSVVVNSQLLHVDTVVMETAYTKLVRLTVSNEVAIETTASVTVHILHGENCEVTSHTVFFQVGCPTEKSIYFDYSKLIERPELTPEEYQMEKYSDLLQKLETNYRPPSSMAVAIPLSPHVYNLDQATINQTRFLQYSFAEKYRLKSCDGRTSDENCTCSIAQRHSSLVEHSNCRERVYKVRYNTQYSISVSINMPDDPHYRRSPNKNDVFVYLEELNGRNENVFLVMDDLQDKCIDTSIHRTICEAIKLGNNEIDLKEFMSHGLPMFNATELNIKFMGQGLFHFRILVANGFSFCKLSTEFQVFVINSPLPFPVPTIIRITVTFLMAGTLVLIFIQFHKKEKLVQTKAVNKQPKSDVQNIAARRGTSRVVEEDIAQLRNRIRTSIQQS